MTERQRAGAWATWSGIGLALFLAVAVGIPEIRAAAIGAAVFCGLLWVDTEIEVTLYRLRDHA